MSDFEFVDDVPPSYQRSSYKWGPIVEKLQAEPGRWAIVDRRADATNSIFSVARSRLLERGCEATTRKVGNEVLLYARWPEVAS